MNLRSTIVAISATGVFAAAGFAMSQKNNPPEIDCIMTDMYQVDSSTISVDDLRSARDFRDGMLAQTPIGNQIIALYYTHSSELKAMYIGNAGFRQEFSSNILQIMPMVRSGQDQIQKARMTPGGGFNEIDLTLQQSQADAINGLLNTINAAGSPSLQADVASFQSQLGPIDNLVGLQIQQCLNPNQSMIYRK